jgi:hypothetical protein
MTPANPEINTMDVGVRAQTAQVAPCYDSEGMEEAQKLPILTSGVILRLGILGIILMIGLYSLS